MTHRRFLVVAVALAALGAMVSGCGIGDAQARLRTAIDAKKPTLDECYRVSLVAHKHVAGEMQLAIHVVEATGLADAIEVKSSTVKDAALHKCVETALVGTKLEPTPNANLKVDYTLRFAPAI